MFVNDGIECQAVPPAGCEVADVDVGVSYLCLCMMALNARPSLQLVVKLRTLTLGHLTCVCE